MDIQKNIDVVLEKIALAAEKSKREPSDIMLVAVSKTFPYNVVNEAVEYGIDTFGENYVQEFIGKYDINSKLNWHFIGQLQSNKVKYIVNKVALLHSLDRMSLAKELNKRYMNASSVIDVLIQVNIGLEAQKGGVLPSELEGFIDNVSNMQGLKICGLMCIHPMGPIQESIQYFRRMKCVFDDMNEKGYNMKYLSMGMSNDYVEAIQEGANIVRVGSAIFGNR